MEMTNSIIVVFGATGTIGNELVPQLLKARQRVRIAVRDPAKAAGFAGAAEIVRADLSDPASLTAACADAHKAFVVSGGEGIALEPNVFDAAKAAGIEHVVRVSALEVEFPELAATPLGRWHLEAELRLRGSGVPWTILRPSYFSSNTRLPFIVDRREGRAYLPADGGKEAPIDPHDIAAVAVAALTTAGHEYQTYLLTGPELLTFSEMMAKLSAVLGRTISHIAATEEDARRNLLAQGIPAPFVHSLLGHFTAVRAGRVYLTSTVSRLLGRPARSFDDWLRENAAQLLGS
jgi:uncharacterized protein YbjT (DUF2867 family)